MLYLLRYAFFSGLFILAFCKNLAAQNIAGYFEKIRTNAAALTTFFSQMPKGGDLHHHFSGSVYPETFLSIAVEQNFYIDTINLEIAATLPEKKTGWVRMADIVQGNNFFNYQQLLLQKWSAKDFNYVSYPTHRQFFEAFSHFGPASDKSYAPGLLEIKNRAVLEHVSYIETSLKTIPCNIEINNSTAINESLEAVGKKEDEQALISILDTLYQAIGQKNAIACARDFNNNFITPIHDSLQLDDTNFKIRYQTFVLRILPPLTVFKNTIVAFEVANSNPLVAGVNIVAPEHYDVSMNNYWLHMQFFKYCHKKYPNVKYSMHAGELTLGLVKPEELTWHISSAVYNAGANRIGHGVDMAYEKNNYDLLKYMALHKIAIEINLYSNEFILGVKDDRHPILLYKKAGVPIVICTDDAGILRTNHTEQFVLLAKRYPQFSYTDIKQIVYNSIQYSFINDPKIKKQLLEKLARDFKVFEKKIKVENGLK